MGDWKIEAKAFLEENSYLLELDDGNHGEFWETWPDAPVGTLAQALAHSVEVLKAIRDYEPVEVCKDEFAYDRMVEGFRKAAREGLESIGYVE